MSILKIMNQNQNKIGLFLDDDLRGVGRGIVLGNMNGNTKAVSIYTDPNITWIHVKNYQEFVDYISNFELPYIISFDNDLGEEKEGIDCATYLCEWCIIKKLPIPLYIVHSQNSIVNKRIYDKLNDTIKYETTYLQQ